MYFVHVAVKSALDVDMAIENFKEVRLQDPYRLDNMDTYSNALYVKVITDIRNTFQIIVTI